MSGIRKTKGTGMETDTDKIDEVVLALLHLTCLEHGNGIRAWTGHDWETLNRLLVNPSFHIRLSRCTPVCLLTLPWLLSNINAKEGLYDISKELYGASRVL